MKKWSGWGASDPEPASRYSSYVGMIRTTILMVAGGSLRWGKTSYADNDHAGFWIGVDRDKVGKINIGGPTWFLRWTGASWESSLFAGLADGAHAGMVTRTDEAKAHTYALESVDRENVPLFTAWAGDQATGADRGLMLGYADLPNVRLVAPIEGGEGALGEWHLVVDVETFSRLLGRDDVDLADLGAALALPAEQVTVADAGQFFAGSDVEAVLQELGAGGGGSPAASSVSVADAGGYFTGTDVEAALQEIGADLAAGPAAPAASAVAIADAGSYFAGTDVEAALQDLGGTRAAGVGAVAVSVADAGSYFAGATVEAVLQDLGGTRAAGVAASSVSVADAGNYFAGTNVETALQEAGARPHPAVGAGADNMAAGTDAVVCGGRYNTASGDYATIGGGQHNTASGDYSEVTGGRWNSASALCAMVSGGYYNSASGNYARVGGGSSNQAKGTGCTISSGQQNTAGTGGQATVGGGVKNTASGGYSVVGGGYGNQATAVHSRVGGGKTNTASGKYAVVVGGKSSTGSGDYAVAGGLSNVASGKGSVIGGGASNTASRDYSALLGGKQGKADRYGQVTQAAGMFSAAGDAQTSVLVARNVTTNATPTVLFLDGSAGYAVIRNDTCWAFDILVVGRVTATDNEGGAYRFVGCIDNNANTVALVGTVTKTVIAEDTAAWDANVTADNTNKALIVTVTGAAGKNIRWVARITLVEVTG